MKPIIIIGAGLAGYSLAREIRKADKTTPLTIITADAGGFYSKPTLSNAFALKKLPAQLVTQSAAQMAEQLDARILTGCTVRNIDVATETVRLDTEDIAYGKLVLAVGAQPIRLSIAGNAADEVLSVNNVDDYDAFRRAIDAIEAIAPGATARITILGAGLIGCEFADDLSGAGHKVTVIDPARGPLAALTSPDLSAALKEALEARGIDLRFGTTASEISRTGDALQVILADGSQHQADLVLSAVGLRPDTRLAYAAGLKTGRGILIDAWGQTSAENVYALGDCAEYAAPDGSTRVLPYVAPLLSAARAIARTLTGTATEIDHKPMPVMVKTPSYPLALMPPAPHLPVGDWHTSRDDKRMISRCYDGKSLLTGFGVSHHDMASRNQLLAALGLARPSQD